MEKRGFRLKVPRGFNTWGGSRPPLWAWRHKRASASCSWWTNHQCKTQSRKPQSCWPESSCASAQDGPHAQGTPYSRLGWTKSHPHCSAMRSNLPEMRKLGVRIWKFLGWRMRGEECMAIQMSIGIQRILKNSQSPKHDLKNALICFKHHSPDRTWLPCFWKVIGGDAMKSLLQLWQGRGTII